MYTMKDIIREGNPILKKHSTYVIKPLSDDNKMIMEQMIEYIFNSIDDELAKKYNLRPAVGIAAPQVGVNLKMLVIYCFDEHGNEHFYPMVNPKIISYSEELTYLDGGEGCLSVDRVAKGYIHRPKRVTLSTLIYDKGNLREEKLRLKGYPAVVFQHEYDHLNGILFVDRINKDNPFFIPQNSSKIEFDSEK